MTLDDRPIFLVGFMGSGKSAVGAALGRLLAREFIDTDRLVEQRDGRAIAAIFDERGEAGFRELEQEALNSLAGRTEVVIATGGGLFVSWPQRRHLKRWGRTVWLDVPLAVARERIGEGRDRPRWSPDSSIDFRVFFERRRAVYSLAELRVPGHPGSPDEIAANVARRLAPVFP